MASKAASAAVSRYLRNKLPPGQAAMARAKRRPPKKQATVKVSGGAQIWEPDPIEGWVPSPGPGGGYVPGPDAPGGVVDDDSGGIDNDDSSNDSSDDDSSSSDDSSSNDAEKPTVAAPPPVENFVPADFESYLGMFGLPADVIKELTAIFRGESDASRAAQRAIAYVRGTSWYAQTYPGIQEAFAKGIVRDERDYRARLNDFNQVYRQYATRDIRLDEYAQHLREGVSLDTVGRRFQGAAIATTYGNDWQYLEGAFGEGRLSGEETTAFGQQSAGLDSPLGLRVQRRLQLANERIKSVFSGQLALGQLAGLNKAGRPPDIGR